MPYLNNPSSFPVMVILHFATTHFRTDCYRTVVSTFLSSYAGLLNEALFTKHNPFQADVIIKKIDYVIS